MLVTPIIGSKYREATTSTALDTTSQSTRDDRAVTTDDGDDENDVIATGIHIGKPRRVRM